MPVSTQFTAMIAQPNNKHKTRATIGRPALHLPRTTAVFLGIYSVVVGIPYFLLWLLLGQCSPISP